MAAYAKRMRCDLWGTILSDVIRVYRTSGSYSTTYEMAKVVEGMTPLHWAAETGALGVIQVLLRNGANALTRDGNGAIPTLVALQTEEFIQTGLCETCEKRRGEIVRVLLEAAPEGFEMEDNHGQSLKRMLPKI
ncbi:hypothetical protein EJ04DRAFT_304394 [Polyplosphaeria fusca]|uniref:Uncharacterized protein n=1 Tax=Polyplosphaeria fusca TaxID=682080 RepID=A0A9P4QX76_9PLEO|nr:hypothetical protein EJ04DRAFT_304394 [Polyplosphaeria fusca]